MTASCSELNPVASPRVRPPHRGPTASGCRCALRGPERSVALRVCAPRSNGGTLSSVLSSTRRCSTNPDPDAEVGASPGGVIGAAGGGDEGLGQVRIRSASFGTATTAHQLQIRLLRDRAAGNATIASRTKPYIATGCRRRRPRHRIRGRTPCLVRDLRGGQDMAETAARRMCMHLGQIAKSAVWCRLGSIDGGQREGVRIRPPPWHERPRNRSGRSPSGGAWSPLSCWCTARAVLP